MSYTLQYCQCPHGFSCISLDDEGGGTRLTSGKCCGLWETVKSFSMDAAALREAVCAFENAIEELEKSP